MAIWGRFQSILFGGAIGAAARTAVEPQIERARQEAWKNNQYRVLDAALVGRLRAQGLISEADAKDWAERNGFADDKREALEQLAMVAPGMADARTIERRKFQGRPDLSHAYAKAQIEPQYWPALDDLLNVKLSAEVVALAMVRGLIDDQNILPVAPPTEPGKVKQFPRFNVDGVKEAEDEGIDLERLKVLVGISGRPMGPEAAAAATFRGIIAKADYDRAVGEGDVRNEWAEAIFDTARQIPSVADYVNARIRGWITVDEMNAGVARHGMSPADAHLLYLRTGRPAAPGQMATAAARGIDGPDGVPMNEAQFLKGIAESDIRPEWGPMLWESRFLYPPLFQLTRLVQGGAITADVAAEWATKDRYPPEVVQALHAYWSQPATSGASPLLTTAKRRLYTTAHNSFLADLIDEGAARGALETAGAALGEIEDILAVWTQEKGLPRKDFTQKQVQTLLKTGEWTRQQALDWLVNSGLTANDATALLDTW